LNATSATAKLVCTEPFDGPLELLLFLVRRAGVDIRDVPIAPITDEYLAHLSDMKRLNLNLAGEFLVIASTLCFLKSRELMPQATVFPMEYEEDPAALREALARRLLSFERFQDAAKELGERAWLGRDQFCRPPTVVDANDRPVIPGMGPMGLLQVYGDLLEKKSAPPPVHHVTREHYSLEVMASRLMRRLEDGPRNLKELLKDYEHQADRVVAFLATLELAKLQMLDIQQEHHLGPVVISTRLEPDNIDFSALSEGAG